MFLEKIKKNKEVWFLILVIAGSFFLRSWKFEETLYFKMDQARDAELAQTAFEQGPGYLPLLGPRAAGTFLRLGPGFYYLQYLATLIFQNTEPWVMVVPDLFFSLASIGLLYYFLRQFFAPWNALLVSSLYAFSFLSIQYSRFAWNPNSTPFWSLLFLLTIYKVATVKNRNNAGKWLLLTGFAYGMLSQLHYTALLVFPLIAIGFWIFYRPVNIKKAYWLASFLIVGVFYVPMLISEFHTDFDNWHQFTYALQSKGEDYPLLSKIAQSSRLHGMYYSLALTSYGNKEDIEFRVFFGFLLLFFLWQVLVYFREGKIKKRKAFLFLICIWFAGFGAFYTKMAFTVLKPRFWLMIFFVPYIFLAMLFKWLYRPGHKRRGRVFISIIAITFFIANLHAIGFWYWSLNEQVRDDQLAVWYARDLVLKQEDRVGLGQVKKVVDKMSLRSGQAGKEICFYTDAEYRAVYEYAMKTYHPGTAMKRISFGSDTNDDCIFFSIAKSLEERNLPKLPKDHKGKFQGIERTDFGVVTLWETKRTNLSYLEREVLDQMLAQGKLSQEDYDQAIEKKRQKAIEKEQEKAQQEEQKRLEMNGLVEEEELEPGDEGYEDQEAERKLIENREKPRRKERVFWKDAFNWDVQY